MTERMSPQFALFNQHVNKAGKRARKAMRAMGHIGVNWLRQIDRLDKKGNGIMYILNVTPTPAIACYIGLVTAFVNENADPPSRNRE